MFDFEVTPDEGTPFRVSADSRTISVWERTIQGRSMGMLDGASIKMMYLEELAHLAARRAGKVDGNLADFRDTHTLNLLDTREDGSGPTGDLDPT